MIKLRKNVVKLDEFTDYVGHYCGYEDYHVLDKLDELTPESLTACSKEIENRNFVNYPYYENLKQHIFKVLESRKKKKVEKT